MPAKSIGGLISAFSSRSVRMSWSHTTRSGRMFFESGPKAILEECSMIGIEGIEIKTVVLEESCIRNYY